MEPEREASTPALVSSAPRLLARSFRARRGFGFRLGLSRAGRVTVRVERLGGARASRVLGTVRLRGRAGMNKFTVKKVERKRLRPGRYRARVTVSATDSPSRVVTLRFRLR